MDGFRALPLRVRVAIRLARWLVPPAAPGGLLWAAAGVAAGVPAALALTRLLRGLVYGVETTDPMTFFVVPVTLLAVAGLAGFLPARGATRVQPADVLAE